MSDKSESASGSVVEAEAAALRQAVRGRPPEYRLDLIVNELASLKVALAAAHSRIKALETASSVLDVLLPLDEVARREGMRSDVVISAEELLIPEDGFYHAEDDDVGRTYRWTGPSPEFSFRLMLDRSTPAVISLEVLGTITEKQTDGLACFCGNQKVRLSRTTIDRVQIYQATLPATSEVGRATHLRFLVPEMVRPSEAGMGPDQRVLGVRFSRLTVRSEPDGQSRARSSRRASEAGERANGGAPQRA